jgi:ribosome-associated protein
MRASCNFCDFFVIVSAASMRQAKAIAEAIEEGLQAKHITLRNIEGKAEGLWILLDCDDVIVHIFQEGLRHFYGLERLWQDAQKVNI